MSQLMTKLKHKETYIVVSVIAIAFLAYNYIG